MTLARTNRYNPLHVAALCAVLVLAIVMLVDPLFPPSPFRQAGAVGGYDAVNVLGPNNFTGAPTWETVFFPVDSILEFTYDDTNEVIWAVTGGDIYYCAVSSGCDEESDWTTYSLSSSLSSIMFEPGTDLLYVGRNSPGVGGEIMRCDVSNCDDSGDWSSVFLVDVDPTIGVGGPVRALAVGGGFIFAGIEHFFNDTSIFRCDISSDGCDDTADWVDISPGGGGPAGGRIRILYFDDADDLLFAGYFDSDDSGYILRCDLSDCDDSEDWTTVLFTNGPTEAFAMDDDDGILYAGTDTGNGEGEDRPAEIFACDVGVTGGCDEETDWVSVYGGFEEALGTLALLWEPTDGVIYALGSGMLRCDASDTGCDATADWESVTPPEGNALIQDPVNNVLHAGSGAMYRCDVATGCRTANEMDQVAGVAHDEAGERLFVADFNRHRVLVYDIAGGIVDGEEPVIVLGQIDFEHVDCNDGNGPGTPDDYTVCTPYGLEYDESNDRLFVGDYNNNRVMVWDLSGPVTNGMAAAFVLGQPDFLTADCETDQTSLCGLQNALAYDSDNERLFVGDRGNSRVMVFDVDPGTIANGAPAINVVGTPDFTTDPGSCTVQQNTVCSPEGLALNADDQILYAVDPASHRVTSFDVDPSVLVPNDSGTDGPDALNVLGQDNFTSTETDTTSNRFLNPSGLSYDSAGSRLFVADTANNRVLQFDTTTVEDGEDAVDVYGQDDFTSSDTTTDQSHLWNATDVQYMEADNLIAVSDTEHHRVMFFEAQPNGDGGGGGEGHEASDVIGQMLTDEETTFDHGAADMDPNNRSFDGPGGAVIDTVNHRLFVADPGRHRVMVFNLDGDDQLIDRVADNLLGQDTFRSTDAGTSATRLITPLYVAYDEENDSLFVSDYGNNRVMVFDLSGGITDGMAATWVLGQPDFDTSTIVLDEFGMSNPRGVAFDSTTERLFVGSQDHQRVLVYDISGGISNGMAASWVLGQEDFTTAGTDLSQDGFGAANNVAVDSEDQRLFVDDSPFNRVMVFDISTIDNGEDAVNVIGQDDFTSSGSDLDQDSLDFSGIYGNGLAYDADNQLLYVGDGSNRRVVVFNANPAVLIPNDSLTDGPEAVNVLGQVDFDSDDDSLHQGSTRAASGLVYDANNSLLYTTSVGDVGQPDPDNRISIFDVSTIDDGEDAVDGLGQVDENDEPIYTTRDHVSSWGFTVTTGVTMDAVNHRLFVSDYNNHRVLVFDLDTTNRLDDHNADAVLGQPNVRTSDPGSGANGVTNPGELAFDPDNNLLFVADTTNNRVLVFDTATIDNGEDAIHVLGQETLLTTGAATSQDGMDLPQGLGFDATGDRLFVVEGNNNRVLVFDVDVIDDGEDAINVLGQDTFLTNTANTTVDGMDFPGSARYTPTGTDRLFVSDTTNNRVLVFDLSSITDGMDAVAVIGQGDFDSGGAGTSQSELDTPAGISLDEDQSELYVSEVSNHRVTVFDVTTVDNGEDAVDVYGQADFDSNDADTTQTNFVAPENLFWDTTRNALYVSDTGNNRIMIFAPQGGGGGGPDPTPEVIGFIPQGIVVNDDEESTDTRNVEVLVNAGTTRTFEGRIDVVLSNDPGFHTGLTFSYNIPGPGGERDIWPVTIAWDLCFGIPEDSCDPGAKTVYARFYANVPAPSPAVTPLP